MDFDGDGDLDLVVNCPDKPYNGTYFFENPGGGGSCRSSSRACGSGRGTTSSACRTSTASRGCSRRPASSPTFARRGFEQPVKLPLPANVHRRQGPARTCGTTSITTATARSTSSSASTTGPTTAGTTPTTPRATGSSGPLRGFVYLVRNDGHERRSRSTPSRVKVEAGGKPVETFGWPSPNFADFDGDGDLDLLCGEFLDGFTYFENTGTRTQPAYAAGPAARCHDGQPLVMDLEMIVPAAIDWDARRRPRPDRRRRGRPRRAGREHRQARRRHCRSSCRRATSSRRPTT